MPTLPLIADTLALCVAPLLAWALSGRPRVEGFANGLTQLVVSGLVLVHVLPFGVEALGWPALVLVLAGVAAGSLAHGRPDGETAARGLAMVALLVHGLFDGAGIAGGEPGHGEEAVAWAVVVHSVPVGLATWRLGLVSGGPRTAAALLTVSVLSTWAGYVGAGWLFASTPRAVLAGVQSVVAGALLHVLGHLGDGRRAAVPSGLGALVGLALLLVVGDGHPLTRVSLGELGTAEVLRRLALEAAPALLGGYLAAGLLHSFVPGGLSRFLRPGPLAGLRGALAGLPFPVASCGAPPLYRGLLAAGAPVAAAGAFLVAGPALGVGALALSLALLGPALTGLRVGATLVLALAAGRALAPLPVDARPRPERGAPPASTGIAGRFREALRFGLGELVEHTAPWVLAGWLVAAVLEPVLDVDALAAVPAPLAVGLAALVGVPAYVCATGAAPLVAVLLHKGLGAGAALAFLLTGPATGAAAFGRIQEHHGRRAAWVFGLTVGLGAAGLGLAVDLLLPPVPVPELHVADGVRGLSEACLAVLTLLFAATLVRRGPAGFLEPMLHPHEDADDALDHDHHHAHDHGHHHAHAPVGGAQEAGRS